MITRDDRITASEILTEYAAALEAGELDRGGRHYPADIADLANRLATFDRPTTASTQGAADALATTAPRPRSADQSPSGAGPSAARLTSSQINKRLRAIDDDWGINRPPALRGVNKSIPYVGGYWHDFDWDADQIGLARVEGRPGYPPRWRFALLERHRNKWPAIQCLDASEYDSAIVRYAAELAAKAANPYTLEGLFDVVQWAGERALRRLETT